MKEQEDNRHLEMNSFLANMMSAGKGVCAAAVAMNENKNPDAS
jgi:hypothetical protein